jgi:hypothetical protein
MAPDALKRADQRRRERRFLRALAPIVEEVVQRSGLTVQDGPFAGLRVTREVAQVPKLAGTYELELHDAIREWVAAEPDLIVNVGCGEGYYAVGLARAAARTRVRAHDIDAGWQRRCRDLARLNDVADRVTVAGRCTLEDLRALPASGVALLLDCEGCEVELLRPDEVPAMAGWPVLVELHDFLHPGLTDELLARFAATHDAELIEPRERDSAPAVAFLDARRRRVALDEFRPPGMRWAHLRPR